MEKFAVIMAGGSGQRLWPLSRENKPKQFIQIDSEKTLLVQTIERLSGLIPVEKCFIITNKDYFEITKETVKDLIPVSNIILEPIKKDTAACISYATFHLEKKFGDGLVLFIPADSYVKDIPQYQLSISQAFKVAEKYGKIVIIGVKPTYPATGYGYIQIDSNDSNTTNVVEFREKPDLELAQNYLKSRDYLWNSGMVVGRINGLMNGIKELMPNHYAILAEAMKEQNPSDLSSRIEKAFNQLEGISFDYAFLEKSKSLKVVRGLFDWYDIGNLDVISMLNSPTNDNNWIFGQHVGIDTENTIIYSLDSFITTIGLNEMIVVEVDGRIIVCPRDRAQDVKSLVRLLKDYGYDKYI